MARTEQQVIDSLASSVETIDPTIDVHKGPFKGSYIDPFGSEIVDAEVKVEDLGQRYSTSYIATQNDASADLYGENHGIERGEGEVATGFVYFYTYTPPVSTDSYIVQQGAIVTDRDGLYAYRVVYQVQLLGSRASSYYNAEKRWYEVRAQVEALAAGDAYDLPQGRVQRIVSDVPNFSGVDQRTRISGGASLETSTDYMERIDSKLHGEALGSMGGVDSTVRNFNPSATTDVAIVYSNDTNVFTRPTSRPALDAYVIGQVPMTYEQTYQAGGLETELLLERVPAKTVESVYINGVLNTDYELVLDTSLEYGTSALAADKIKFATPLSAGDDVSLTYTYNSLISDLNTYMNQPRIYLFETETLAREGLPVGVEVVINVTLLSTYDPQLAESSVLSALDAYLSPGKFRELSYPDDLRVAITSEVPYATQVQVLTFKSFDTGILEVEVVELNKNEYPYTDETLYTINIESTL